MTNDLQKLTLAEASVLLEQGKVSSLELCGAYLQTD